MGENTRDDCYTIEGKLALPYTYFAGETGSKFITTLRDAKKILGVRCPTCEKVFVPPRKTCERCLADLRDGWVEVGDEGTLVGHTVVRYEDRHLPRKPPYVLGLIKLDGADTPLVHIVEGAGEGELKKGLRLKARFAAETTTTLLDIDHFEPV